MFSQFKSSKLKVIRSKLYFLNHVHTTEHKFLCTMETKSEYFLLQCRVIFFFLCTKEKFSMATFKVSLLLYFSLTIYCLNRVNGGLDVYGEISMCWYESAGRRVLGRIGEVTCS